MLLMMMMYSVLERDNRSLRQKVEELTEAERLHDARMTDLKWKLSESTANSKRLLQAKQKALKDVADLVERLDATRYHLSLDDTTSG